MHQVYGRPALGVPAVVFGSLAVAFGVAAQVPEANYSVGGIIALVGFGVTAAVGAWKTIEAGRLKIQLAKEKAAEDRKIEAAEAELKIEQLRKDKDRVILESDIERARLVAEKEVLEEQAEEARRARTRATLELQQMEQRTGLVGKVDAVAAKAEENAAKLDALTAAYELMARKYIREQLQNMADGGYIPAPDPEVVDSIPIPPAFDPQADPQAAEPPPAPGWRTVLIVDDHASPAQAMKGVLEWYTWRVEDVSSCAAAADVLAREDPPARVILNLKTPDHQAPRLVELIERLRGRTRVVMFTAGGTGPLAEEAARLKPDAMFPGPVDFRELMNAIGTPNDPSRTMKGLVGPPPDLSEPVPRLIKVEAQVEQLEVRVEELEGGISG